MFAACNSSSCILVATLYLALEDKIPDIDFFAFIIRPQRRFSIRRLQHPTLRSSHFQFPAFNNSHIRLRLLRRSSIRKREQLHHLLLSGIPNKLAHLFSCGCDFRGIQDSAQWQPRSLNRGQRHRSKPGKLKSAPTAPVQTHFSSKSTRIVLLGSKAEKRYSNDVKAL